MDLDDILQAINASTDDGAGLSAAISAAVRAAADDGSDMQDLEASAVSRFQDLQMSLEEQTGPPSEDDLSAIEGLVQVVEALRAHNVAAMAAAKAARERLALLASRVETRAEDEADEDEDGDGGAELAADDGDGDGHDETPAGGETQRVPAVPERTPVAASAPARANASRKGPNIPLGQMRSKPSGVGGRRGNGVFGSTDDRSIRYVVTAADVPGATGRQKINDIDQLGQLVLTRMQGLARSANSAQAGIATITRYPNAKYMINQEMDLDRISELVTDERELPGGSLIAAAHAGQNLVAGGMDALLAAAVPPRGSIWCSPQETLWDLCPDDSSDEGYLDVPTITTRRAGVRYPSGFDFADLYGGIGFYQTGDGTSSLTNAKEVGKLGTDKKCCVEIPCPGWEDCDLEMLGLCVRNSILLERSFPEWTREFTRRVLKAHRRKVNAWLLAKLESLAIDAGTIPAPTVDPNTLTLIDPFGPGMFETILGVIERLVEHQRYRYRLSRRATLEMVAPYWLLAVIRSDLAKKGCISDRWNVTDAQITNYLASRGVRVQWVYDWQDSFAFASANTWCSGSGGKTSVEWKDLEGQVSKTPDFAKLLGGTDKDGKPGLTWPDKVTLIVYPAGAVFRLQQDVVQLMGTYDHASLLENKYTSLFSEEGQNLCRRCYEPIKVTVPLCPNGLSGGSAVTLCTAPDKPAPDPDPDPVKSAAQAPTPKPAPTK